MSQAKEIGARIAQARRLKGVRERRDIRPVDLARAVKVSGASVSDWEAGKNAPREELLARIAAYLGVTREYLRYGITPGAPMVEPDPALDRKITEAELAKARELVERQPKRKSDGPHRKAGGDGGEG